MLRRFGVNYAIFSMATDILLTCVALFAALRLVAYIPLHLTNLRGPAVVMPFMMAWHIGVAAFQLDLLVLLEEELGIGEARTHHLLVTGDDEFRVRALDVGDGDEAGQQLAVAIQQREIFLVLLHGEDETLLWHFKELGLDVVYSVTRGMLAPKNTPDAVLATFFGVGTFVRVFSLVNGGRATETDLFEGLST